MPKLNVAFSLNIDDRKDVRDTIIKLDDIIKKLRKKWKMMEVK